MSHTRLQRGAAALPVAVLLLFAMALIAFFANRSLLVEQKSAANQYRAAQAFELAEAGLEWASAMLDDPRPIDAQCAPAAAGASFRDTYLPTDASLAFAPPADARPSCRIAADDTLACSCPASGANPALGSGDEPSFSIALAAIASDPQAAQLTAWGCTGQGAQCIAGATRRSDASARNSVILKARPLLRSLPAATLTAGGPVSIGGGVRLTNLDASSQGSLVVAGGAIDTSGAGALATLPGSPSANALYANDATLAALATQGGDAFFNAFFGMTLEAYRQSPTVLRVSGATPAERAAAVRAGYAQGYAAFFVEGELLFDASGVGAERPVLIVTADPVRCSAACAIHGLLYADTAARDASDLSGVSLRGALVTRGAHGQAQGGEFAYDADVLSTLRRASALLVRVPGSWRDF